MNASAIILARAGSRGVPGKNRAIIAGRACAAWSIEDARRARHVTRVALSTDDPGLWALAQVSGVEMIQRPASLADDGSPIDDAARHAAMQMHLDDRTPIVILYANVPVRPAGLIDRALELLTTSGCDSVQSYAPVGKHHPWWTARVDEQSGAVRAWQGDVLNHGCFRRQDLPPAFVPDGGVIALTRRALFREIAGVEHTPHAFLGADHRGVMTRAGEVIDIDDEIDLVVADAVLRRTRLGARWAG